VIRLLQQGAALLEQKIGFFSGDMALSIDRALLTGNGALLTETGALQR